METDGRKAKQKRPLKAAVVFVPRPVFGISTTRMERGVEAGDAVLFPARPGRAVARFRTDPKEIICFGREPRSGCQT